MVKTPNQTCVLAINGGSSSIKFALYQVGEPLERGLHGKVDCIGSRRMTRIICPARSNSSRRSGSVIRNCPRWLVSTRRFIAPCRSVGQIYLYDNPLMKQLKDKLIGHKQYIDTYGEDMPEIRDWKWGRDTDSS